MGIKEPNAARAGVIGLETEPAHGAVVVDAPSHLERVRGVDRRRGRRHAERLRAIRGELALGLLDHRPELSVAKLELGRVLVGRELRGLSTADGLAQALDVVHRPLELPDHERDPGVSERIQLHAELRLTLRSEH